MAGAKWLSQWYVVEYYYNTLQYDYRFNIYYTNIKYNDIL